MQWSSGWWSFLLFESSSPLCSVTQLKREVLEQFSHLWHRDIYKFMDNATWTTQSTPLTKCHGQSHHLHMTSIHHFIHVNISCTHISTSTYNMSFHVPAITHTQSSHVMAICTYKLITCQYIRTHILTSKHVTLSQAMTLSNKSYYGPKASHKQSQTEPRDRPQTGHKHRPHIVTGSPRHSLPSPR